MTRGLVRAKKFQDRGAGADPKAPPPPSGPSSSSSSSSSSAASSASASSKQPNENESDYHRALEKWTGKVPATILNEMCQRNQWERAEYHTFPSGAQRFKCTVTLGKRENKKTSDVTTIHFTTPGLYGSSNEAKHHGAVYALHNAFPQLQIHHMLPPGYREYFLSLEQEAKQGAKKATKPNSSAPAKPLPSSGSSSSASSSSSSSSSATSSSSSYSKPALAIVSPSATAPATSYEKYDPFAKPVSSASTAPPRKTAAELWRPKLPSVHLGFTSRQLIDQLLKEAGPDAVSSSSKVTKASSASAAEKKALSAHLTRLGFQTAHISEALHWCSNLEDALDWLCLYVPEDTLPPAFQPSSTTRLVLPASLDGDNQLAPGAIVRLVAFGFNAHTIEEAYGQVRPRLGFQASSFDDVESLVRSALWYRTVRDSTDHSGGSEGQGQDQDEQLEMESVALQSILGEELVRTTSPHRHIVVGPLGDAAHCPVTIHFFVPIQSRYPDELPEVFLESSKVPAYVRFEAMRRVHVDLQGSIGMPSMYEVVSWLENKWADLVAHPPALLSISKQLPHAVTPAADEDGEESIEEEDDELDDLLLSSSEASSESGESIEAIVDDEVEKLLDAPDPSTDAADADADDERVNTATANDISNWEDGSSQHQMATVEKLRRQLANINERSYDRQSQRGDTSASLIRGLEQLRATRKAKNARALPAESFRQQIISSIRSNAVVIIAGETGCGKSTQVPQFILEDAIAAGWGADCNIVCTQPRRIAATAVAQRIASERGETIGSSVGYAIRLERKTSNQTKLLLCTTGILLRRLQQDPTLKGVSHVIVDEVHERSVDSDVLLTLLRNLLASGNRLDLRIVLMSASINGKFFSDYFAGAPVLQIPGYTFAVQDVYLEDIVEQTGFVPTRVLKKRKVPAGATGGDPEQALMDSFKARGFSDRTCQTIAHIMRRPMFSSDSGNDDDTRAAAVEVDHAMIAATVNNIVRTTDASESILIFVPGMGDIRTCLDQIKAKWESSSQSLLALPLHSSLTADEQAKVFARPKSGQRKVIASTNIAETSVTIDDIVHVIDTGLHKDMTFDDSNQASSLAPSWIAKANAQQRRGRAGRVKEGVCYRLFTRDWFDQSLLPFQPVEIQRIALEQVVLMIMAVIDGSVATVLENMPTPPPNARVSSALSTLKRINLLDAKLQLTPLGRHVASFPLDHKLAKTLIYGVILCCLNPALTIAAALASKSPFVAPFEKRTEAHQAKQRFSAGKQSDLLAIHEAFMMWQMLGSTGERRRFCEENFLSHFAMTTIQDLRSQYVQTLRGLGFVDESVSTGHEASVNSASDQVNVLRAVLVAGLYPQVARVVLPRPTYRQVEGGVIEKPIEAVQIRLFTEQEGRVFLHPSSCLFKDNRYSGGFVVFHDRLKSTKLYLMDATTSAALPILLFGGQLTMDHQRGIVVVDNWLRIQASARVGVIIRKLRRQLDSVLMKKINDPALPLVGHPITEAILCLLNDAN